MSNVPVAMEMEVLRVRGFEASGDWENNVHIPISHSQYLSLKGRILTHLEALGLPPAQETACKSVFRSMLLAWWNDCIENSATAAPDTIQPIVLGQTTN
jgi:hypothetical protein